MYRTQLQIVRHLTKFEYKVLLIQCNIARKLYNVARYYLKQSYTNGSELNYYDLYHLCKRSVYYTLLQAGVAQQVLKQLIHDYQSFKALLHNPDTKHKAHFPRYKGVGDYCCLTLQSNAIRIKDSRLRMPFSRLFRKQCDVNFSFSVPLYIKGCIKEVRIIPSFNGHYFRITYCYETEDDTVVLNPENTMAIDFGVDNLATCVTNDGTAFIMDGRKLKSINQHYNKQIAYYRSIAYRQGQYDTRRTDRLTIKRNNQILDIMRKTARYVINYCLQHDIGTLIVGVTKGWKQRVYIGKRNNQNFVGIPFYKLRGILKHLCERYGIVYVEQEESYTSKASALDMDTLPVYQRGVKNTVNFSGKRVFRGLYRTGNGRLINADVNGALNIMRKGKQNFVTKGLCTGYLATPLRIRRA